MGRESVFTTPRKEKAQSATEMLESAVALRRARMQNLQSLTEAYKASKSFVDNTQATMEAAEQKVKEEAKREQTLENLHYRRGSEIQTANKYRMRPNLEAKAGNLVGETALYKIIYEAYYLDEPVKERLVESIEATIDETLSFIQENCVSSVVPKTNYSKFLQNVEETTNRITTKAIDRIMQTAMEHAIDDPDFELNEEECDELDGDLSDLGKDEIVDLIKAKVASVVQDERERGEERGELFNELDNIGENPDNPDAATEDGELSSTEESTIITEAALMEGMVPQTNPDGTIEMVPYTYTFESAIQSLPNHVKFSSGEQRILDTLMECSTYDVTQDPNNDEFKSYVSGMCKAIVGQLSNKDYRTSCNLITDYADKLSSVSELDGDTKSFVNAMTSTIYAHVPPEEIIIHRLGKPVGSPGMDAPSPVNTQQFDWTDLLVNIKTNLNNVKSWCITQLRNDTFTNNYNAQVKTGTDLSVEESTHNPFERLQREVLERQMNQSIGQTLFESMMLKNIKACEETYIALESTCDAPEPESVEKSALVESLLEYTVFETLSTLGIYNFRSRDLDTCRHLLMSDVSESKLFLHREDNKGNLENKRKKKRLTKHIIKPHDSSKTL